MAPHRSWQWSLTPLGGRESNDNIANLSKCKDFGPPVSMSATGFSPPTEKYHIKTRKMSMTKKRSSEILRDVTCFGKCLHFFGKRLKKVVQKFRKKCCPRF